MNRPELEAAFNRHLKATAHLLLNVRGEGGSCRLCEAPRGAQHLPSCPAWPLIDSRITFRMAQELPPPAVEVLHDSTGHFYRRRRA